MGAAPSGARFPAPQKAPHTGPSARRYGEKALGRPVAAPRTKGEQIMLRYGRLLSVGLVAALMLAGMVRTASANRLSVDETNFSATFAPIGFSFSGAETEVRCPITLEGSFASRSF